MEKLYLTWQDVENNLLKMSLNLLLSGFKPTIIFGLARGGLIPSVILSHLLNTNFSQIQISLRDGKVGHLSNQDNKTEIVEDLISDRIPFIIKNEKILIVDDINDSGKTLSTLKKCLYDKWRQYFDLYDKWGQYFDCDLNKFEEIWASNIRTAVLVNNLNSEFDVDLFGVEINKAEKDVWVVFPWENVKNNH